MFPTFKIIISKKSYPGRTILKGATNALITRFFGTLAIFLFYMKSFIYSIINQALIF